MTLEQSILPRGHVPPGLKGLVRGLCAHQIRCMMEDLRKELQRRKDGGASREGCPGLRGDCGEGAGWSICQWTAMHGRPVGGRMHRPVGGWEVRTGRQERGGGGGGPRGKERQGGREGREGWPPAM